MRQNSSHEVRQRLVAKMANLHPTRAFRRRRRARHFCYENCKLERKMSEHMPHDAWEASPLYFGAKQWRRVSCWPILEIVHPFGIWDFHH